LTSGRYDGLEFPGAREQYYFGWPDALPSPPVIHMGANGN